MAMASWMIRSRTIRSGRFSRSRQESEEDAIKLDLKRHPHANAREILSELSKSDLSNGKRLNHLNNFVKLTVHVGSDFAILGYTSEEILYCLRYSLVNESTQIRSGAFRAIRHVVSTETDVAYFNKLLIPYMVVRSLDMGHKNDVERVEAMKLVRKVLLIAPESFNMALSRCLVSLANGGIEEKDRMLRVCLAALLELGTLNPNLFIASGGVSAITRNLLECQTPKISESLCGVLLLLLDKPITRNYAAVDLHCVAAPYCDFHYRHGWMDKNRDERELRFNCSRLALLTILRSWPGILHFCSPNDMSGLKAIVDILYLNQLEVRKAVLDLLYELLNLPQPEWTDELSVALSAIDPAEPQASWRLGEGFVMAEGRSVLPHLARTTPSISDMHLSLLLYCFLETGLLGALAEVIATSDTFISVRATVLLGELLRLIQILLPPECCNITPALPNLLEYATTNRPQALRAVTALQQLHKLLKRRPASYSLYLDFILQSGNFVKTSHRSERAKKRAGPSKSRLTQLVRKDGEDDIKGTGVLQNKDAFTWNWNLINIILKNKSDHLIDLTDTNHRSFLKRLVEYYMPSSYRYSHMDLTTPKNTQGYTIVGVELVLRLLEMDDAFCTKLLHELFADISERITAITSGKSAHDCLFSPQHMANTQCQSYFLFIGRLTSTAAGTDLLKSLKIFKQLEHLATTTNHDCYVKLIISSLDYTDNGICRDLLSAVLTCPNESSRLYATQFLLVLLRAGVPNFSNWGMRLLAGQLKDKSRTVYLSALATIHEACEIPDYLEQLIKINPELAHLGEKGMLLLIRFLSVPSGFGLLNRHDFLVNELKRWHEYFMYRYVFLIEGETSDALTLHQRGEDGRYDKRTSSLRSTSRKDLFLPPHIYGQLSRHQDGFQLLLEHGHVESYLHTVDAGFCETEDDILKLKAALWALGHLGSSTLGLEHFQNGNVLKSMVKLAENCTVYSIKATAFYSLGLIASTKNGADSLFKLGWVCTRHDRHDKWPVIEEENWEQEGETSPLKKPMTSESSDKSEMAFASEYCIPDADSSTTTEEDMLTMAEPRYAANQGKSLTLPHQNAASVQHKRSLSESKTFELLGVSDRRERADGRLYSEFSQYHRYRDNSITESTTSGVSSCESVLGKSALNERIQTLTPIPSISSLQTIKTPGIKLRRHSESSRRVSSQSMTPTERPTISPAGSSSGRLSHQDLIGYETIRMIRMQKKSEEEFDVPFQKKVQSLDRHRKYPTSYTDYETGHFGNYLMEGGLSLTSLSSVKKFSVKDNPKQKGQCYMGIALPITLTYLFPEEQAAVRRLSFGIEKSVFEDSDSNSESEVSTSTETSSRKRGSRFTRHNTKTCLNCSYIREKLVKTSIRKDVPIMEGPSEDIENSTTLKHNILTQVELLANPVALKQARQVLLDLKQKHPAAFQDLCLYSEVCKMVSENTYRLVARRLLQDMFFDVNFERFSKDLDTIFANERRLRTDDAAPQARPKIRYSDLAREQRKLELSTTNKPSNSKGVVVVGFTVESGGGGDEERFSPTKFEPRSPPLSSVKEENVSSSENLLNESVPKQNSITHKTDTKPLPNTTTLDQLKFTYNENKFPIKSRDDKNVIK